MNPLFIHGYSKSGTSLLVALLDGHPDINVIPEESDYFDGIYFLVKQFIKSDKLNLEQKIDIIYYQLTHSTHIKNFFEGKNENDPRGNFDYRDFDTTAFEETFKAYLKQSGISHQHVFDALAKAYIVGTKKSANQKYWLEKTPYHDLNVSNREQLLNNHFDHYKVIHIFRDPRDNYLAYSKKRPELSIYDICFEWKRISNLALKWKKKEHNLIIRYEDLVLKTEETMKQILAFLSLKSDDCIYEPTKNGVPWLGNSMFGQKSTKISSDRVNRYKKMMDDKTREIIESCCAEEMKALAYLPNEHESKNIPLSYQIAKLKSSYKEKVKTFKLDKKLSYKY